jgi:hypothetical protein
MGDNTAYKAFRIFLDHWLHPHYKSVVHKEGLRETQRILSQNRNIRINDDWDRIRVLRYLSTELLYPKGVRVPLKVWALDALPMKSRSGKIMKPMKDSCADLDELEEHVRSPISGQTDRCLCGMTEEEIKRVVVSMTFPKWN